MVNITQLRQDIFKLIFSLIDDNKLSGTQVYTSFNDKAIEFPIYVIHPVIIRLNTSTYGQANTYRITVFIELFSLAKLGKEMIDKMADNLMNIFINNEDYLKQNGLFLDTSFYKDSDEDTFVYNKNKFHYRSIEIDLTYV